MIEVIMISTVSAAVYTLWRKRKMKHDTQQAQSQLPAHNFLLWPDASEREKMNMETLEPGRGSGYKEAAVLGGLGSLPSFYYVSQIDGQALDALDFAFAEDLSNFNDLHDFVNEKYLSVFDTDSADGWMTRLEGYVMEQHAAEALEKMGYDVKLPDSANQEGWDILLDGEPWQIKGGETAQVISDHFENYPDIPVITNTNLGGDFSSEQVMTLEDIDATLISETTEHSIDAIDQLGGTMGAGIPVVAAMTSGFREWRLHREMKTNVGSSVKNAGLDIVGTGGGGFTGAQVGAGLGAIGGPVGAAIGGLIGGIAGAIGGKAATNVVKEEPLRRATSQYDTQVQTSENDIHWTQQQEKEHLQEVVTQANDDLNQARQYIEQVYKENIGHQKQHLFERQHQFVRHTPHILRQIREELKKAKSDLEAQYRKPNLLKRTLFPSQTDIFHREAARWFNERFVMIEDALTKFERYAQTDAVPEADIKARYVEIIDFFQNHVAHTDELEQSLVSILEETEKHHHLRDQMKKDFYLHLLQAETLIKQQTAQSVRRMADTVQEQKNKINEKLTRVIKEREKLGY